MISNLRLQYATEAFLGSMRRAHVARGGDPAVGPKTLADYSAEDRGALMNAIKASLSSAEPANDQGFNAWIASRNDDHGKTA